MRLRLRGGATAGSLAVGSSVFTNVNGTKTEFIVVHQGKPSSIYDDSCNGTWLLMKDIYENRQWNSSKVNDYANSTINSYLNSTFLAMFDLNIQKAIKQVKIPYHTIGGSGGTDQSGANGLTIKTFLLSVYELGWTTSDNKYFPHDGAKLDYFESGKGVSANDKRIAKLNGSDALWWTRSPNTYNASNVQLVHSDGSGNISNATTSHGIRPAFIIPSETNISKSGLIKP